ncbi:hypothetical protein [Bradyrhizobium sp. SZCCHNRI1002]|uniref:hypothetical protein n=1 Tax=Bradyrhizobium sp. SZCCHNRI1002 TaxID=3057274 RepID=UPI0028E38481|nr:hypothetical protein [Bradyrhizobium sp. SZCCHNRI1002]
MTDLTHGEVDLLRQLNGHSSLFTEYTPDAEWAAANSLRKRGLLDGKAVLTGTARVWLTDAGKALAATL